MNVRLSTPLTVLSFQAEDFVEASGRISLLPEELPSARFVLYTSHLQTAHVLSHSFVTGIFSCTLYVHYFSSQSALLLSFLVICL